MARAASRIYVPLDANFFDDDKIIEAGEAAGWLFLNMMAKAKQLDSDGLLTRPQIERLAVRGWQKRLDALVKVHAVEETMPGVYVITKWLDWNESKAARSARLEADRDRKKRGNRGGNA